MPIFRHLSEFEPEKESITAYVERAQLFLDANDTKKEKTGGRFVFGDRLQDVSTVKKSSITEFAQEQDL